MKYNLTVLFVMLYFKVDTKHTYIIIQPAEMGQHEHYYDYLFGIMFLVI